MVYTANRPFQSSSQSSANEQTFAPRALQPAKDVADPLASIFTQPHASVQSHLAKMKGDAENISHALDSIIPSISIGNVQNCAGTNCQTSSFVAIFAFAFLVHGIGALLGFVLSFYRSKVNIYHICSWASALCLVVASSLMLGITAAAFVVAGIVSRGADAFDEALSWSDGFTTESGPAPALYLFITIIALFSWILVMYEVGRLQEGLQRSSHSPSK